jgi:hypothetical protein
VGANVEVNYKGEGDWLSGCIARVRLGGSAYDIKYDNGKREMGVKRENIREM